jgi:hypothetical protein
MADAEDAFNFAVGNAFQIQLQGFDYIVGIDVLAVFQYRKKVMAIFAVVTLSRFNDATFRQIFSFAFWAGQLLHAVRFSVDYIFLA